MVGVAGLFVVAVFVLMFIAMIYMDSKTREGNKENKKDENKAT